VTPYRKGSLQEAGLRRFVCGREFETYLAMIFPSIFSLTGVIARIGGIHGKS